MGSPQESRYLSSPDEVSQVFRFFRDQQSEIKLRFSTDELGTQSFAARVLDLTDEQIFLQNIIPAEGVDHLRNGESFSISGRADGLFVYISDNSIVHDKTSVPAGVDHCVSIALPTTVLYQQRRSTERVRLPVQIQPHHSHIRLGDIAPMYGRILDISATGLRVHIEPARQDTVRRNQRLENCLIHVPNQLSIEASFMVRHVAFKHAQQTMTCGLELLDASESARAELSVFAAKTTNISL